MLISRLGGRVRVRYILPVAGADDAIMRTLSRAWGRIRAVSPGVPAVSFDLTPSRSSSCSSVGWYDSAPVVEVNLMRKQGDGLAKLTGTELMAWLLHQAAHGAAGVSTASEGRHHPEAYREAAEELGLYPERTKSGWSHTELRDPAPWAPEIGALDIALKNWEPVVIRAKDRGPQKMVCACDPPRTMRMNSGVAARGPMICATCKAEFQPAE